MPWLKVSDQIPFSPKFIALPLPAVGLWTLAGAWSAQHLTDGHVPAGMVFAFRATETEAAELVKAGLWEERPDGYAFHDWLDYQPSRAQVEAEREATRQRVRQWRAQRKGTAAASSKPAEDHPEDHAEQVEDLAPPDLVEAPEEVGTGVRAPVQAGTEVRTDVRAPVRTAPPALALSPAHSLSLSPAAAAAAAAAREDAAAAGDAVEDLRARLESAGLHASWRTVTDAERTEVAGLLALHGPARLVEAARREHRSTDPARFARAWLGPWRELRPVTTSTRARTSGDCPDHPGEHPIRCPHCARTAKAMPPGFREHLRRSRQDTDPDPVDVEAGEQP